MSSQRKGWTGFLRDEGSNFLGWIEVNGILAKKFDSLAAALWSLFQWQVSTSQDATEVWEAVPAVLHCLDSPATYEKPGTAWAYAWLYLLERYVRTWFALNELVAAHCLPMGRYGVRSLDVGTGPGPSAFAVDDFYSAMTEFAELTSNTKWRQPARVICVEYDRNTNHLRHLLAEILYEQSMRASESVLAMTGSLRDFGDIMPTQERKKRFETLRYEKDEYYDDEAGLWTSEPVYWVDEAHDIAQSLHRYRLIVFSNFLTTVDTVARFEQNLVDILHDAKPGSVIVVLGGKGRKYAQIYNLVDQMARTAGFEKKLIAGGEVTVKNSTVEKRIYEEGQRIYKYLQELAPSNDDATKQVRIHFEESRRSPVSSKLQVYRKY